MKKTVNIRKIDSINDVKTFFNQLNIYFGLNWSPDDDFQSYDISDSNKLFLDNMMDKSFQICDNIKIDLYLYGFEINKLLR